MESFSNFKFGGTLFSKIMPNFCIQKIKHIHFFDTVKLIFYPWVRNSTTQLTVVHSTAGKIAVQDHKGKIEMSSQSTKSDA